jgi:hypothetical protein
MAIPDGLLQLFQLTWRNCPAGSWTYHYGKHWITMYIYIILDIYIYIQWTTNADFLKHFETALSMSFNAFQGGFKEMIS